jgi:hypothetical protein
MCMLAALSAADFRGLSQPSVWRLARKHFDAIRRRDYYVGRQQVSSVFTIRFSLRMSRQLSLHFSDPFLSCCLPKMSLWPCLLSIGRYCQVRRYAKQGFDHDHGKLVRLARLHSLTRL